MTISNKLRFSLLAVAFPWATALACGGRTGDLEPFDVASSTGARSAGSGAVSGNGVSVGSTTGPSGTSTPGNGTSPPSGTISHPPTGSGGRPAGSFPSGSGGYPSYAGSYGAGGWYDEGCTYPACNCTDCVSACACGSGMQNLTACVLECNGGSGGSFGTGGATGFAGAVNGPSSCVSKTGTSTSSETCPTMALPVNTCCTSSGHCGVELVSDPVPPDLPFLGGCQPANQPGYDTLACPDLGSLIGVAPSASVAGCCRPDGTCGIDLGVVGVGCVQTVKGGAPIYCAIADAGTGAVDAAISTTRVPADAGRD